jgi:hypothetical protein
MKQTLRSTMKSKIVHAIAAGVLVLASIGAAFALTIDQTRNVVARVNTTQQTSYYRITVNFNDANIGSTTSPPAFGKLFQHTYITSISCHVLTAFNAVSTNVFTMGTTPTSANELIDAATSTKSIDETSATYQSITSATSLGEAQTSAGDVTLYAKYTQTGTAATTGKLTCVVEFIPNNDK